MVSLNLAYRSATGATVVWSHVLRQIIAHKIGDTWYDGAYAPAGFVRTPIRVVMDDLDRIPVIPVADALATMAGATWWCGGTYAGIMPDVVAARAKWWAKITDGTGGFKVTGFCSERCMEAK